MPEALLPIPHHGKNNHNTGLEPVGDHTDHVVEQLLEGLKNNDEHKRLHLTAQLEPLDSACIAGGVHRRLSALELEPSPLGVTCFGFSLQPSGGSGSHIGGEHYESPRPGGSNQFAVLIPIEAQERGVHG